MQKGADFLNGFAGHAVDDPASALVFFEQMQQLLVPVLCADHAEIEVRTIEARDAGERLPEAEQGDDVGTHVFRGSGGKGSDDRTVRQRSDKSGDPSVARAEILSPLGYAVRLVHSNERDRQVGTERAEFHGIESFRRNIDELVGTACHAVENTSVFRGGQGAVAERGGDRQRVEGADLILHQGDKGRDHKRDAGKHHRRDLVAEGFPGTGGHHA